MTRANTSQEFYKNLEKEKPAIPDSRYRSEKWLKILAFFIIGEADKSWRKTLDRKGTSLILHRKILMHAFSEKTSQSNVDKQFFVTM